MNKKEREENYRRRILSEGGVVSGEGTGMSVGEWLKKNGMLESFREKFEKSKKENEKYKRK